MTLTLTALRGPVRGWHVREGLLWLELPDRGEVLTCACGRAHLLPSEDHGLLHVRCHACGQALDVPLLA